MNTDSEFDFKSDREFPELSKKLFKMEKISNQDLGMSTDTKVSNPHESCRYVHEENNKSPIGLRESPEVRHATSCSFE